MRQVWHGQRLQPDAAGASQLHQEQPVATEDRIGDAADHGDVERDAFLEHPDMARMYQQRLAGAELMGDNLAAQFHPGLSVAGQALQDEALAAEDAAAERALQGHAQLDALHAAQEAVTVNQITAP